MNVSGAVENSSAFDTYLAALVLFHRSEQDILLFFKEAVCGGDGVVWRLFVLCVSRYTVVRAWCHANRFLNPTSTWWGVSEKYLLGKVRRRYGSQRNCSTQKNIKRMRAFSHLQDPIVNNSLHVPLSQPYPPSDEISSDNTPQLDTRNDGNTTISTPYGGNCWYSQHTVLAIVLVVGCLLATFGVMLSRNFFVAKTKITRNKPSYP